MGGRVMTGQCCLMQVWKAPALYCSMMNSSSALLLLTVAGMGDLSGGLTTLPLGQQGRSHSGSHYPTGASPVSRYPPTLGKDFGMHPNNLRTAFETSTLSPLVTYTINLGLTTFLDLWFFPYSREVISTKNVHAVHDLGSSLSS